MTALPLARWQFAITTVYHFFFVPLTLVLILLALIMRGVGIEFRSKGRQPAWRYYVFRKRLRSDGALEY